MKWVRATREILREKRRRMSKEESAKTLEDCREFSLSLFQAGQGSRPPVLASAKAQRPRVAETKIRTGTTADTIGHGQPIVFRSTSPISGLKNRLTLEDAWDADRLRAGDCVGDSVLRVRISPVWI